MPCCRYCCTVRVPESHPGLLMRARLLRSIPLVAIFAWRAGALDDPPEQVCCLLSGNLSAISTRVAFGSPRVMEMWLTLTHSTGGLVLPCFPDIVDGTRCVCGGSQLWD